MCLKLIVVFVDKLFWWFLLIQVCSMNWLMIIVETCSNSLHKCLFMFVCWWGLNWFSCLWVLDENDEFWVFGEKWSKWWFWGELVFWCHVCDVFDCL